MKTKILYETERLIVREYQKKDIADLFEMASDKDVTKFLHFKPYTDKKEAKKRISWLNKHYKHSPYISSFAVELKENGKVVGDIAISNYRAKAGGIVEIGYMFNKDYQGKGLCTESVKGVFKFIKEKGFAKRIHATHDTENVASGKVMQKAGMTFEGISRKAGENNLHLRYDVANYSILIENIKKFKINVHCFYSLKNSTL